MSPTYWSIFGTQTRVEITLAIHFQNPSWRMNIRRLEANEVDCPSFHPGRYRRRLTRAWLWESWDMDRQWVEPFSTMSLFHLRLHRTIYRLLSSLCYITLWLYKFLRPSCLPQSSKHILLTALPRCLTYSGFLGFIVWILITMFSLICRISFGAPLLFISSSLTRGD